MMKTAGKSVLRSGKGRCLPAAARASSSFASLPVGDNKTPRNVDPNLSYKEHEQEQEHTKNQQQQENEWNNPDGAADPKAYVRYLDGIFEGMSSSGPVGDYKRTVYDLMEIRGGDSIVDVGCGTGADVLAIAELLRSANNNNNNNNEVSNGKVVGVDISDTMIRAARKNLSKCGNSSDEHSNTKTAVDISFCTGNAENLDGVLPSDSFDICRCDRSLQHVPHPQAAVHEMVRITKSGGVGGRIIISEPDWETLVIDSPSHAHTTRHILQHFTNTRVNGWMGRQLSRLLKSSPGIVADSVRILPLTSPVNDLRFLREAYLDKAQRLAVEASVCAVTEQEASDWMEELVALDEAGMFFSTLTMYVARANVH